MLEENSNRELDDHCKTLLAALRKNFNAEHPDAEAGINALMFETPAQGDF